MRVSKIHSFRAGLIPGFLCFFWVPVCGAVRADSWDFGRWAGLTYAGEAGPGGRTVGWLRVAKGEVQERLLEEAENRSEMTATLELRQQSDGRSPILMPSFSWLHSLFECYGGSRDIPGKDPVFLSDLTLPGGKSSSERGSPELPRGRRFPSMFFQPLSFPWLPGLWGARSILGPGLYYYRQGIFFAYSPREKIWGAQLRSSLHPRVAYLIDFEGQKKQTAGFAFFRLYANERTGAGGDHFPGVVAPVVTVEWERSPGWDNYRYRNRMADEPYRPYRSWYGSAMVRLSVLRLEGAGQDQGDTAFRVASLEREPPSQEGWYFIPALRWHGLRIYSEGLEKHETRVGLGAARVKESGVFRVLILGGGGVAGRQFYRSLSAEATAGFRFEKGSFAMGIAVTGSEDRDSFTYLSSGTLGQGRSRFYDRATHAAVLRAGFSGFDISFQYCLRRDQAGKLRDQGYLVASATRSL